VPYFHVVFTVPEEIAAIALQNKEVVYAILFRATAETLTTIVRGSETPQRRPRRASGWKDRAISPVISSG
jgi:hypothetical protein